MDLKYSVLFIGLNWLGIVSVADSFEDANKPLSFIIGSTLEGMYFMELLHL
jgi:hypothetical protein